MFKQLDLIVLETLKKLDGYLTTFYYDCEYVAQLEDPEESLFEFQQCKNTENFNPHFHLEKPPEFRVNPYTGKKMERQKIDFPGNQVSVDNLKSWIVKNVPDFSIRLARVQDYNNFNAEEGIAKVYLLSAKNTPSPIYAALTTNFRDKVRFAFTSE